MFDALARNELEEMLGYERFAIGECVRQMEIEYGHTDPFNIVIHDTKQSEYSLTFHDSYGCGGAAQAYKQLSGLLFIIGFKILDMIIEWMLRENGMPDDKWRFSDKLKWLGRTNLVFPGFLGTEIQLRNVLLSCYQRFLPYRNAMTHGQWGQVKDGALHFDFKDVKGIQQTMILSFKQVMAWVQAMSQVSSMLVAEDADAHRAIKTTKRNLDLIQTEHGGALFSISLPCEFRVVRRTISDTEFMVDMKRIRSEIEKHSGGRLYEIQLRVERSDEGKENVWEIPPELVPIDDFLLDRAWDRFKVNT